MNLKQLESFIVVVEQGSFSKAAPLLYTSPTALTQQLNALERYLKCQVLERSYKGVSLTKAGEDFYKYAKQIISLTDEAVNKCRDEAGLFRGSINIGSYREFEMAILRGSLERFAAVCPDIQFYFKEIDYRRFFDLLKSRELDLFIHPWDPDIQRENLCFLKLGKTGLSCNMAKNDPLAGRKQISLADLRGREVIVGCGCGSHSLDGLREYIETNEPGIILRKCTSDNELWLNILTKKHILVNMRYCAQFFGNSTAVPLDRPEEFNYGFVYRSDTSEAVRRFLNFMRDGLRE